MAPASGEVEGLARQYIAIRIWGAPATIALYAITGWLIAVERTRAVLVLQLWINGVNVVLDLWFVLGLGWGVPGVAVATLIAEWTRAGAGPVAVPRRVSGGALARTGRGCSTRAAARDGRGSTRDIMVRTVVLQASFTTFVFLGAGQGDVTLAANQVLMQFLEITAYALDGFAFAAEALVGQAVGARARGAGAAGVGRDQRVGRGGQRRAGACLLVRRARDHRPDGDAIRRCGRRRGSTCPGSRWGRWSGIASWMFDGIFIGATLTREMRNAMIALGRGLCAWRWGCCCPPSATTGFGPR